MITCRCIVPLEEQGVLLQGMWRKWLRVPDFPLSIHHKNKSQLDFSVFLMRLLFTSYRLNCFCKWAPGKNVDELEWQKMVMRSELVCSLINGIKIDNLFVIFRVPTALKRAYFTCSISTTILSGFIQKGCKLWGEIAINTSSWPWMELKWH